MEKVSKSRMSKFPLNLLQCLKLRKDGLSVLMDSLEEALIVFDAKLNFVRMNTTAKALFDVLGIDVEGKNILDVLPDIKETERYKEYLKVIRTGKSYSAADIIPSSKFGNVHLNVKAFKVGNGLGMIVSDITGRKKLEQELQESEEKYRAIVETSLDGIYQVDTSGKLIFVNDSLAKTFGYKREELLGKHFSSLLSAETLHKVAGLVQRTLSGEDIRDEVPVQHRDRHDIPVSFSSTPLTVNGKIVGLTGILRDISERKRIEDALHKQAHDLGERVKESNCIYSISEIVSRHDVSAKEILQRIVEVIPSGWQYPEITCARISLGDQEFITKNFRLTNWKQSNDIVVHGKRTGTVDVCYLEEKPEMDEGPFLKEERSLLDTIAERLGGIIERNKAADALEESEAKYRSLIETAGAGVATIDLTGALVLINEALCKMIGYSQEELLGRNFADFLHPDDKENVLDIFAKGLEGEREQPNSEFRGIHKDGHSVWCHSNPTPIVKDDEMTGFSAIIHDITERKKAEESLKESEAKFRELADSITDVFFAMDKDLRYTYWNKASEELTGIKAKDAIGRSILEVFPYTKDLQRAVAAYREVLEAQQPRSFVNQHQLGNKNYFFEISAYPSRSGLSVFVKDITKRKQAEDALHFTRFALDNTTDEMVCVSRDARYIDVNDAFCRSVGYSREELLSMTVHDIDLNYSAKIWSEFWEKLKQSGSLTFESCHRTKDGKVFPVEVTVTFFEYKGKEYHCGFAHDITERKKAEEALRQSEERFHKVLDNAIDMIYWVNLKAGTYDYVAPSSEKVIGYTPDELIALGMVGGRSLVHPDDSDRLDQNVIDLLTNSGNGNAPSAIEYRFTHKKLGYRWMFDNRSIVYDGDEPVAVVGSLRDITERKKAEEALRESEEKYRLLAENVTDVIWTMDMDLRFTYISPSVTCLRGLTVKEAMAERLEDIFPPSSFQALVKTFEEGMVAEATGLRDPSRSWTLELEENCKDGSLIWVEIRAGLLRDQDGRPVGLVGVTRDITERKKMEERERRRARDLDLLSKAALSLVELSSDADMHRFMAERLQELAEGSVVLVSSFDETSGTFCVREVMGIGEKTGAITGMLGRDLIGMHVPSGKWKQSSTLEESGKVPGGLYDLTSGTIPMAVCQEIEKLLDVGNLYAIGFTWEGKLYGSAVIGTRSEAELENMDIIQTFVRQASIALQRRKAEEALRRSEEKFRNVLDNSLDMMYCLNLKTGKYEYISPASERILGYGPEELIELGLKKTRATIHPDDLGMLDENALELISSKGRTAFSVEYRVNHKELGYRWVGDSRSIVYDADAPAAMVGSMRDVTERKKADESLKESEERYRALVSTAGLAGEGIMIVERAEGNKAVIAFVNDMLSGMLGYQQEEMLGMPARDLFLPGDRIWLQDKQRQRRKGKALPSHYAVMALRKDGSMLPIEISMGAMKYRGKSATVVYVRDITERKQAEELLRASEAQFRAIFEGAAIGVGLLDVKGQPFRINPALREMLGYTVEELRSMAFTDYMHPDDATVDVELFREVVKGKRDHYQVEKRYIKKDGQMAWGRMTLSAVRGLGGKLQFAIGMVEDITESKQAIENLRKSERYFRALTENALDATVVVGKDGIIKLGVLCVNPPRGYRPEEVIGTNGFSTVHPEDMPKVMNLFNELMQNPSDIGHIQLRVRHRDSSWRIVEAVGRNFLDDPAVEGIVVNYRDVTDRERAQEDLLRHTKQVEALHAIAQTASQTLELEELLNTSLDKVIEVMEAEAGCVYLLDMVEKELVLRTSRGVSDETISRLATIRLNENNVQKIKEWQGGSTPLRKIFGETGLSITKETKEEEQIKSFAVAPFAVRGQLSGLIAVGNRAYRKFSPADMDLLRAVGNQIGIGAQNAMLYQEVQALIRETIDAQEKERERICLEVHDGVAQTLVSAFQYLQALGATPPDDAQTKQLLDKTSAQVKQAIQESREIINSLQPATLSDLGLVATLRQELKRLGQETGLKIDFKADAIRLSKDIETGLYRIIREAVFNARKHANTKQLSVKIHSEDGGVSVEVRDWGKGFDKAYLDRARKRGTGLFSIRKRAELLQGACEIESEPGQGTTVRVEIPVSAAGGSSQ